jgi:hypothetical protein
MDDRPAVMIVTMNLSGKGSKAVMQALRFLFNMFTVVFTYGAVAADSHCDTDSALWVTQWCLRNSGSLDD